MPARNKRKTTAKPVVKPERPRWPREMDSRLGPGNSHQRHVPMGVGKHRKSFGHV